MEHIDAYALAYLENRLDPPIRAEVESHLAECAVCQAELLALQDLLAVVSETGRTLQKMPVSTASQWAIVRNRWQSPLVAGVRNVSRGLSRRISWQVAVSMVVAVMVMLSGVSLNSVRADSPDIPAIQTPGAELVLSSDTPTLAATQTVALSHTPTQTLTLTVPPIQ